ncbi:MAG: hypothetical protein HY828_16065 [Actinobacteria bacterium]|nr:hypothetical protein [Actinomycetota bacterium]
MSLRVEYHEFVDLDLVGAWNWYEDQEHGLGDRLHQHRHPNFGDDRRP